MFALEIVLVTVVFSATALGGMAGFVRFLSSDFARKTSRGIVFLGALGIIALTWAAVSVEALGFRALGIGG